MGDDMKHHNTSGQIFSNMAQHLLPKPNKAYIGMTVSVSLQSENPGNQGSSAPTNSLTVAPVPKNQKDADKCAAFLSSLHALYSQQDGSKKPWNKFVESAGSSSSITDAYNQAVDATQAAKDAEKKAILAKRIADAQAQYNMESQPLEEDATSPPASPAHTVLTFHTSQPTTSASVHSKSQEKEKKKEKKNKKKNRKNKKARKSDSRKSDSSSSDSSSEEDSEADSSSDSALSNEQKGKKRGRPELSEGKANNKKQRSSLTSGGSYEDISEGSNKTEKKSGWQWFKY